MSWDLKELIRHCNTTETHLRDGTWVPARPVDCRSLRRRLREAWEVFVGKADSFYWPGGQ